MLLPENFLYPPDNFRMQVRNILPFLYVFLQVVKLYTKAVLENVLPYTFPFSHSYRLLSP